MPNIGPLELAIVGIIALVMFGPRRLPELGKSLGAGMREFKDSVSGKEATAGTPRLGPGATSTGADARPGTREKQVDLAGPDDRPSDPASITRE